MISCDLIELPVRWACYKDSVSEPRKNCFLVRVFVIMDNISIYYKFFLSSLFSHYTLPYKICCPQHLQILFFGIPDRCCFAQDTEQFSMLAISGYVLPSLRSCSARILSTDLSAILILLSYLV